MQLRMEKKNVDTTPLERGNYREGEHYTKSGPHFALPEMAKVNPQAARPYYEYECANCAYSNPYPDRLKEHLDGSCKFRLRKDPGPVDVFAPIEPDTVPAEYAIVEVNE